MDQQTPQMDAAWSRMEEAAAGARGRRIESLFADSQRLDRLTLGAAGLELDPYVRTGRRGEEMPRREAGPGPHGVRPAPDRRHIDLEPAELVRVVEVLAVQPDHVLAGHLVGAGLGVHQPDLDPSGGGVGE